VPNGQQNIHDLEHLKGILDIDQPLADTHPRFSLVIDDKARDVVDEEHGELRLLIVCNGDGITEEITEVLETETAAIPQMERLRVVEDGEDGDGEGPAGKVSVYLVPSNAKRMSYEKLYPGRESSETYVSDSELFRDLGLLWRHVAVATGRLPEDSPLEHTGMSEFSGDKRRLFPIPPYGKWVKIGEEEPTDRFGKILEAELKRLYPSDLEYAGKLYEAAMAGFEGLEEG
jgi:hypothetical protein